MKIKVGAGVPKHLLEEMEADKPSADPVFWAKSGCRHCHGTGTLGVTTTVLKGNNKLRNEELCSCARKKWQKWQADWMSARQEAKRKADGGNGTPKPVEPSLEEIVESIRPRVDRIDNRIAELKSIIHGRKVYIDLLPHHDQLTEIDFDLEVSQKAFQQLSVNIIGKQGAADRLEIEAQELIAAAKRKRKQAAVLQQEVEKAKRGPVVEASNRRDTLAAEREVVEKDFNRVSRQAKRKIREAESRLDKLLERRHKILKEAGVSPDMIQDSFQLEDPTAENHSSL